MTNKIKRPEKRRVPEQITGHGIELSVGTGVDRMRAVSYNQAHDEWEKYHNYILSRLPSKKEMTDIAFDQCKDLFLDRYHIDPYRMCIVIAKTLAKRLKRIRDE